MRPAEGLVGDDLQEALLLRDAAERRMPTPQAVEAYERRRKRGPTGPLVPLPCATEPR